MTSAVTNTKKKRHTPSALPVCLREGALLSVGGFGYYALELAFRGSRNQRILDVPKSLAAGEAVWTTSPRWLGEY